MQTQDLKVRSASIARLAWIYHSITYLSIIHTCIFTSFKFILHFQGARDIETCLASSCSGFRPHNLGGGQGLPYEIKEIQCQKNGGKEAAHCSGLEPSLASGA